MKWVSWEATSPCTACPGPVSHYFTVCHCMRGSGSERLPLEVAVASPNLAPLTCTPHLHALTALRLPCRIRTCVSLCDSSSSA